MKKYILKIKIRKTKYYLKYHRQWVWGKTGPYRFLGCFVIERCVSG